MCMHMGRECRAMTGLYVRESLPAGEPGRGSDVSPTRHSLPLPSIPAVDMQKQSAHLCGLIAFGDPYGNRTHVTAVKGRCLNRLTNGPYKRRSENRCAFVW